LPVLIDTNVAIHLRDGDTDIIGRVGAFDAPPVMSIITRIELEGGVHAKPQFAGQRRAALDALLARMAVLDFDAAMADAYREIVATAGYSRTRILDRMIGATALVGGLTLVTMNGADFRDITGLSLEIWPGAGFP
jgi:predicted nucleic acid-binding protein